MLKKITIVLFVVLCCSSSGVVGQVPLTAETLWSLGRVSDPKVSPDGKTVLYSVRKFDLVENRSYNFIYSLPLEGGNPVMLLDSTHKAGSASWRPDGRKIIYLSSKDGISQLWQMAPDGTEKKQISFVEADITNYGFNKDGNRVWYTRDVKVFNYMGENHGDLPKSTARIYDDLMMRHWDKWEDESFSHIFYIDYSDEQSVLVGDIIDIMAWEPYDSPLKPFGGGSQICWSPDGKFIAYTCKKLSGTEYAMSTNSDIYLYELETKITTNLTEGMLGYDTYPAFSPDGSKITWLSMETPMYEADRNRLFEYDFKTKTKKELTTGFDYTINSYSWSNDGKNIYFTSGINATDQLWVYEMNAKSGKPIRQITNDMANVTAFSHANEGRKTVMVAAVMSITNPVELFTVDLSNGKTSPITHTNKHILKDVKNGKVEKRMVKATDGKDILTWVIYPPDFDPSKKYPTLLYCQGGPQSTVSQFYSYRWNFQLMAASGYIVVAPNRRGLPSFGTEWNRQISGDWGGQAMKDLLSAIDEVSTEPYVDKDKLGAVGASFGGYSVFWLAGNHNKRFKSFIAHCGVFNLESMYGTTEELFFADFDMGGPYFKSPQHKTYSDFNPIRFVNNWDTPILVIHNELDYRVPISQGIEAFTAARLKGVPARLLTFSDENHWVLKPQNAIVWQREFFGWLDTYLK